jgi:hypothetical protein
LDSKVLGKRPWLKPSLARLKPGLAWLKQSRAWLKQNLAWSKQSLETGFPGRRTFDARITNIIPCLTIIGPLAGDANPRKFPVRNTH